MSNFNFKEFSELPEEDILEWWTEHKLPHPGCPVSFQLIQKICRVCHRGDEERRARAIRECLGNVKFHYTNRDQAFFYFPFKDRTFVVPLDSKELDVNFTFLACLFGRYV